jgi:hypothetical protein
MRGTRVWGYGAEPGPGSSGPGTRLIPAGTQTRAAGRNQEIRSSYGRDAEASHNGDPEAAPACMTALQTGRPSKPVSKSVSKPERQR